MITSRANPTIKQIRKLMRDRKERQAAGLFYIEGLRVVGEAVQMGAEIETLLVSPELLTSLFGHQVVDQQRQAGVPILELSEDVFRGLALKEGPQGLAALVRQPDRRLEQVSIQPEDRWVALDSVADPGNLGTILRTNDAVGGKGVILLDQSTDPYDPAAVRASMGAIFSQQIIEADLAEFSGWKRDRQVTVVGTSDRGAVDYQEYRYPNALVLLMGSERHGLQPQHEAICDTMVRIPMVGRSDSLNLAVATAVILYEIFNQSRGVDA